MDDNNYEELIRMEAEQLAADQFGMTYCDLLASGQLRIRELALERLGAYEIPVSAGKRQHRRQSGYRPSTASRLSANWH